jgi:hypothetical protein
MIGGKTIASQPGHQLYWTDWADNIIMKKSPYILIIFGILAGGLSIWIAIISLRTTSLTTKDLEYFSSTLERFEEIEGYRNSGETRLWLKGKPLPFVTTNFYGSAASASLKSGVNIRIGCEHKEIINPSINGVTNQRFYSIVTLDINNQPTVTLALFNRVRHVNAQIAEILALGLFWVSLGALLDGVSQLQKGKSVF